MLQDDPKEILRASRDADKIHEYVLEFEKENSQVVAVELKRDSQPKSLGELAERLRIRELGEELER
ncbi:hypothetical protein [Parashewanella hymeniacidonis]|uniref:hypothetical protein n=1 Tax=Parashewanella hymeniacidonis TaxID=2807618 RepID=UPI001EF49C0E|nr:hypothetical protein [Parashewanella hymeniacidonis]